MSALSTEDRLLWQAYDIDDIMFFLTGQREHTPDFNNYFFVPGFSLPQQPTVLDQPIFEQQPLIPIQPAPEINVDNDDNEEFFTPPPSPQQNVNQFLTKINGKISLH